MCYFQTVTCTNDFKLTLKFTFRKILCRTMHQKRTNKNKTKQQSNGYLF